MDQFSELQMDKAWLERTRLEALEFAGIGLYRYRFDGTVLFMDRGAVRIFALQDAYPSSGDIAGRQITELVQYLDPVGHLRSLIRRKKIIRGYEWTFKTLAGDIRHVLEDAYLVRDAHTEDESIQVVMRDVTQQRRAELALKASERQFRETLESIQLAAVQLDPKMRIVFCNDALLGLTGWQRDEVLGRDWMELFVPHDWHDRLIQEFPLDEMESEEIRGRFENPILTREGERRFIIWNNTRLLDENNRLIGVTCIGQDITERRMAEEAMMESEQKYRTLVEMFPFSVVIFVDGLVVFVNETALHMLRIQSDGLILGTDAIQFVADPERERMLLYTEMRRRYDPDAPEQYQTVFLRADGEEFPAEVHVREVTYRGQSALQFLVIDITDRLRAQQAVRESERKYRDILESIQEGYYEIDLEGLFTFFNPALCRMLGYTPDEMLGMPYARLYGDEEARKRAYDAYAHAYHTGVDMQLFDWSLVRKDGTRAFFEISISLVREDVDKASGFRGIVRDVTDRKRAENALREAEGRYRELFENANDIVYTHDLEGRFTAFNKAGETVSGYTREEVMILTIDEILAPEYREVAREMFRRKLDDGSNTRYETEIISKTGQRVPIEISTRLIERDGQPVGVQGIARDITERKRAEAEREKLEAQVQHSQKLEGLGVLAGGIAHDFNNLLVGMLGNAGLAMSRMEPDAPARSFVQKIEATAQRAAELTNQMLAYAGKGSFVKRPLNLSELAREMGQLLAASISKNVALQYDCDPTLPMVEGDSAQIHQVILNLVTNASDAVGEKPGAITLRTFACDIGPDFKTEAYLNEEVKPGRYVCLEVKDTGCGMPPETQARIFDPFFSTKFTGRGLGLAAALGIVRSHGGAVSVRSNPGAGTTFRVYFPACGSVAGHHASTGPLHADPFRTWRTSGLILIVDDEETVRAVAEETLHEVGFETCAASDGAEAVEMFSDNPQRFTAVLMDLMMPAMNGNQAIEELKRIRPDVPVILSSGYTAEDAGSSARRHSKTAFIQKPYAPSQLLTLLQSLLAE